MQELPKASLKVNVSQSVFLKRLEGLINANKILHKDLEIGELTVQISDPDLNESYCLFRSDNKNNDRIELFIRAQNWGKSPPTYKIYKSKFSIIVNH